MTKNKTQKTEEKKDKYWKHPQYGTVYGTKTVSPMGYITWPALVSPKPGFVGKDGVSSAPRFEAPVLLEKSEAKVRLFFEEIESMAAEMIEIYNKGKSAKLGSVSIFKDGEEFDHEKYPYYAGKWLLLGRNTERPTIYGIDKTPDGKKYQEIDPGFIVGGHLVRLVITPLITSHGLSFKVTDVQYLRDDGTRFGGANVSGATLLDNAKEDIQSILDDKSIAGTTKDEDVSLSTAADML